MTEPKFYSVKDVARITGISERTIRRHITQGLLGSTHFGPRVVRVSAEQLRQYSVPLIIVDEPISSAPHPHADARVIVVHRASGVLRVPPDLKV